MNDVQDYYKVVRENEVVFRNVLRDLRDNREIRPMGRYVPRDLQTEIRLDDLFVMYSEGERRGRFTINNFEMPDKCTAIIDFQDIAPLSGGGAQLEYLVKDDNSVEFRKSGFVMMS